MGAKYTATSVSGYNASPPADDGSTAESNKIKWSTIKTKLPDPLNTAIAAIDTKLTTWATYGPTAVAAAASLGAADNEKFSDITSACTLTLDDASTLGAGWMHYITNSSTANATLKRTTGADTLDGVVADGAVGPGEAVALIVNAAGNGFRFFASRRGCTGVVEPFAGTTAPAGSLLCYGQAVSQTTYARLYAVLGANAYGTDGGGNFSLPDLRGRVVAGQDDMGGSSANRLTAQTGGVEGDTLGAVGGAETHTLTVAQMPAHSHTFNSDVSNGGGSAYVAGSQVVTGNTSSTGGDGAHNNVQPTIILNYIIWT